MSWVSEMTDWYVSLYGEEFRAVIEEALKVLDCRTFILGDPFDRDEYILNAVKRHSR